MAVEPKLHSRRIFVVICRGTLALVQNPTFGLLKIPLLDIACPLDRILPLQAWSFSVRLVLNILLHLVHVIAVAAQRIRDSCVWV